MPIGRDKYPVTEEFDMFLRFIGNAVRKALYEFRFVMGFEAPSNGKIMVGDHNMFEDYLALFQEDDRAKFSKMAMYAPLLEKSERIFRNWVYPRTYGRGAGFGGRAAVLKEEEIERTAAKVADALLGPGRYRVVRGWLADEFSRWLFDREMLQCGLLVAGWRSGAVAEAICTGLTEDDFYHLMKKARDEGRYLEGFIGRKGLTGWKFNESVIDFARVCNFTLGQYRYGDICAPRGGDVFFDCGACCGDTTLWAMDLVGATGRVVAFEPILEQAEIAKENVRRHLADQQCDVVVERLALGESRGEARFVDYGGSSHETPGVGATAAVVKLDDWCEDRGVWPDFVKMDIEGAELAALKGARETIVKRMPRLAVCVYHNPERDLWEIPAFLKSLVPSYDFYLKKSSFANETVLFAITTGSSPKGARL